MQESGNAQPTSAILAHLATSSEETLAIRRGCERYAREAVRIIIQPLGAVSGSDVARGQGDRTRVPLGEERTLLAAPDMPTLCAGSPPLLRSVKCRSRYRSLVQKEPCPLGGKGDGQSSLFDVGSRCRRRRPLLFFVYQAGLNAVQMNMANGGFTSRVTRSMSNCSACLAEGSPHAMRADDRGSSYSLRPTRDCLQLCPNVAARTVSVDGHGDL